MFIPNHLPQFPLAREIVSEKAGQKQSSCSFVQNKAHMASKQLIFLAKKFHQKYFLTSHRERKRKLLKPNSQYIMYILYIKQGFSGGSVGKQPICNAGLVGSIPGSGRPPWRKVWQPTSVFLPGKYHGQRSLVGYSPWGRSQRDMTEATEHTHVHKTLS